MSGPAPATPRPGADAESCYRLTVAYVGTSYAGWQLQPNAVTVQQRLEEALCKVLGSEVRVRGAGRTDAGVHARGQVGSFSLDRQVSVEALVRGTNRFLPGDVRVLRAERVPPGFDARRDADEKCYLYRLERSPVIDPFAAPFVAPFPRLASLEALREALTCLPGRHDFSAFAKSGGSHRHPVRTLSRVDLDERGSELELRFVGDGFLRGMVRALVGTVVEVARARMSRQKLEALLQGARRSEAGPNAPARGLLLEWVTFGPSWAALEAYPSAEMAGTQTPSRPSAL